MSTELSKQRILIVDDEPINIKLLMETVKHDYKVSAATNGYEALRLAASENQPDLILLDIMMPEIDGYEVCRRLKRNPATQNIPVIFITAKSEDEDETKGLKLGAVDYITKPISPMVVLSRVHTQMEMKLYRDDLEKLVEVRTEALVKAKEEEVQLLEMTTELSFELNLLRLLEKIMDTTKELLSADRCTLFLTDESTDELWSQVAQGVETQEIRFPNHLGIAGSVFTSGQTINIPDAYADDRFNPGFDKKTGYRTRSILCMPVKNKSGKTIGVTQVLNKHGGPFSNIDERRLKAFSAQASIALENAKLFEDILDMRNYNESMLESMRSGIITLNANRDIVKINLAAASLVGHDLEGIEDGSAHRTIKIIFSEKNKWVMRKIKKVMSTGKREQTMDTDLLLPDGKTVPVNLTIVSLPNADADLAGVLIVLEDITNEQRLRSAIARYMTKEVADRLLEEGNGVLGGQMQNATVMFTDIRNFTGISEKIGPKQTVALLNEYFSLMVDIIFTYEGTLDKYIGDAIMAVFGAPFSTGEDADRSVRTAIDMLNELKVFNLKRQKLALETINIGIGINSNKILSGNIGSMKRMDYTVIGDGVNLASRLEGVNKIYGTNIIISESTRKGLNGDYLLREIDHIRVKGKTEPVAIYQILDYHDEESFPQMDNVLELFDIGLKHYRRNNWRKAINFFSNALNLNPYDSVSKLFLDRCRHYLENPPLNEWDGVWVMETK
ncbi:adenylate/guanylate cyclase domain-containing protein [Desulfococcaceae bacterium HSG9]|nr:adenylate/guanylate cyclase domain-containing protein [Desulfococcaceae bacterium HSG9]